MKSTPFTAIHQQLGAKMAEFAGYLMPIEYSGIIPEHQAVCQRAGVFDVSHMGEFVVKGPQALALLQNLVSNDVATMVIGQAQYSTLPNANGGIVDDLIVYRLAEEEYLVVVNASNIDKDWNWFTSHNTMGAELENISDKVAQLAVQGPKAIDVLKKLTTADLDAVPYYYFTQGTLAGVENVLIANTGYTGAGGFELYFAPEYGEKIWNALFEAGADIGLVPVGLGARDTLRLEMGYCLYGNDIDDSTSPIEAALGWAMKFTEGKNFPSRELFEKQKAEGTSRKRVGLLMKDKGIARHGYPLADEQGAVIGEVTSGSISPLTKEGIAMGYVQSAFAKPGTIICVEIRGRLLKAEVVKMPFRK